MGVVFRIEVTIHLAEREEAKSAYGVYKNSKIKNQTRAETFPQYRQALKPVS